MKAVCTVASVKFQHSAVWAEINSLQNRQHRNFAKPFSQTWLSEDLWHVLC